MENSGMLPSRAKNRIKGRTGEALAICYLKNNNIKVLETNYTNVIGEIDIIAKDNDSHLRQAQNDMFMTNRGGTPRRPGTPATNQPPSPLPTSRSRGEVSVTCQSKCTFVRINAQ